MKTITEDQNKPQIAPSFPALEVFSETLRDGRVVTIREMTGRDLIYIEEELGEMTETRRSFHIIELLNIGDNKLTYNEIESLGVNDIKKISTLIAKANGEEDEDDDKGGKNPK